MPGLRKIRADLFRGICILILTAGAARAQGANFALPAQSLSDALKAVAQQTGQNILFTPEAVAGLSAPELHGQMSGNDAVAVLLKGTHLVAEPDSNGGLIVHAANMPSWGKPARPPTSSPPATWPSGMGQSGPAPPRQAAAAAEAAQPETAPPPERLIEQVIVSASRISIGGYQQPTPVTTVNVDQLHRDAFTDIGDAIRQLPAFGASSSPNNTIGANYIVSGTPGIDVVNLRNLGVLRTLVLFNGQRVVASALSGGVDLSTMPTNLVERVDVVTGGASAAWGSDAVAGVVNVILNRDFHGLAGNIEGGDSWKNDHRSFKGELSYGTDFDGDRGHVIGSVSYLNSPDALFVNQRSWYKSTKLVSNPAFVPGNGQPQYIHADNVGLSQATQGGLITASPANAAGQGANALRGIQFVGPNGTPASFDFGNISGAYSNGGSGEASEASEGDLDHLTIPLRAFTFFGYGRYRLADNLSASIELNYGKSFSEDNSYAANRFGTVTIQRDNAYLNPSIGARMDALGITNFSLGTSNLNNLATSGAHLIGNSLSAEAQSLGVPVSTNRRQLFRGVFNLDGSLGGNWSWNAYYQHGESRVNTVVINNIFTPNYNLAVDAVQVTPGNVGASGLAIGSVACRSTLTDPANGCQPLDLFGVGVASPAAIAYINGLARAGRDYQLAVLNQDVASLAVQGMLPWSLGAGQVSVAFGGEYRKEGGRVTVDPLASAKLFSVGNFSGFSGQYNVEEGFLEIEAPLLKDSFVQSLEFNTAGRLTSYSTSGLVETWKLGFTSQITDDIRARTTWSFDIRAPDLQELFSGGFSVLGAYTDPRTGANVQTFTQTSGNRNLKPEESTTFSGGIVLTPHWLPGLSLSADWYSIHISKAIATINASTVVAQCAAGVQIYCAQLVFAGPGGALSQINTIPINANRQTVSGLDFEGDYRTPFQAGVIDLHWIANYTDEQTQTAQGITVEYAGGIGADSPVRGVPQFKTILAATYLEGPWQGTVQGRLIGAARLNTAWGPLNVDDNSIPSIAYLDLRAAFDWTRSIQLYAAIDNLFNTAPPVVAGSTNSLTPYDASIRDDIYDAIGRQYRIGLRFQF